MTDYPQWVREMACELGNAIAGSPVYSPKNVGERGYYALTALADLILKYKTAPVDPVKDALAETFGGAAPEFVAAFHAALHRRGLVVTAKP